MANVVLRAVRKRFGKIEAIRGIDLQIKAGRLTVFVGPSGCGKSTLLRLIAGLEELTQGTIAIGGERVDHLPPAARGIAMVFQSYALYPHMSVYENMAFGLRLAHRTRAEIDTRVHRAARILQIEHLLDRLPKALSGGQRQRVAIGRAIVREPRVFLFDEPLSNLDAALRVQMRLELSRLQRDLGATMIYVTHDQIEAMTLGDTIVVLNDGRVEQTGPPLELYRHPANRFVAGFIGSPRMNFLAGRITQFHAGRAEVRFAGLSARFPVFGPIAIGESITVGIRPEHLALGPGEYTLTGHIAMSETLGSETYHHLRLDSGENMVVRAAAEQELKWGESACVHLEPRSCHLFGPDERSIKKG